jgi:hypothetical protein
MTLSEVGRVPDQPQAPGSRHVAPIRFNQIAWIAASAVGLAALTTLFYFLSTRTVIPSSDGATAVLEGQSISGGHLTLHGWDLSLDSFWTVDALFNALGVAIFGIRSMLLHLVPAFIAALVVLIGIRIARDGRRGAGGVAAGVTVLALLGLPASYFCYFFLLGVAHVGTTLWCLVAFYALRRRRMGLGWFVAVVFLAAGLLGDFQMVALGVVPVLLAGVTAILRTRSWRAGVPLVGASAASLLLALVIRVLAELIGTYSIGGLQTSAKLPQVLRNVTNLRTGGARMLGVGHSSGGVSLLLDSAHVIGLFLVVAALIVFVVRLIIGIVQGTSATGRPVVSRTDRSSEAWRLDDLLLFGCIGGVVTFLKLATTNDFNYDRYLTSAVIFGCILAGRLVGRWVSAIGATRILWSAAALGLAVIGSFSLGVDNVLASPALVQPATRLGIFLESHHLDYGLGDYWSASITTVATNGAVIVRPVISDPAGKLVRYGRQSSATWYAGRSFEFLVYDTAALFGVDTGLAARTFGNPADTYVVGIYRVLVWTHPIQVSTAGFDPNRR